jgi:4-amino-4-deoxychorismate lyase
MLINGLDQDFLPVSDRAVQYGDGLFETIKVVGQTPQHWDRHVSRLKGSCDKLRIPCDLELLETEVNQLLSSRSGACASTVILKIIITRGSGGRGYAPAANSVASRIVQLHNFPDGYDSNASQGIHVILCRHPLSRNSALAGIKHLNRLDQVIASMELTAASAEGLMCDDNGHLIEGIKTNVFFVRGGRVITPALTEAGVAGVMREVILEQFADRDIPVEVRQVCFDELRDASEIWVCNSVLGVWPVISVALEKENLNFPIGPATLQAQSILRNSF